MCAPGQKTTYLVPLHNTVDVKCQVEVDTEESIAFHWVFRPKYETLDIMLTQIR